MAFKEVGSVKRSFNRNASKVRQLLCLHSWEMKREDAAGIICIFKKCRKCGMFKDMHYYRR